MLYYFLRYVDNIALAVPPSLINQVLNTSNSFHNRLQFTLEMRGDKLNFFDITIYKIDNLIEFNSTRYHTSLRFLADRHLNFFVSTPSFPKKRYDYGYDDGG